MKVEFYKEPARVCDRCAAAADRPQMAAGLLDDWGDRPTPSHTSSPALAAANVSMKGTSLTGGEWAAAERARRDRERLGLSVGPRPAKSSSGARAELFAGAAPRSTENQPDGRGRMAAEQALRSMERAKTAGSAAASTLQTQGETLDKVLTNSAVAEEVAARSSRVQNSGCGSKTCRPSTTDISKSMLSLIRQRCVCDRSIFGAIGTLFSKPALTSDNNPKEVADQSARCDDGATGVLESTANSNARSSADPRFAATLDAMGQAMSQAKGTAVAMRDAVVEQNGQLKQIEKATDATQRHVDKINAKMGRSRDPTKVAVR